MFSPFDVNHHVASVLVVVANNYDMKRGLARILPLVLSLNMYLDLSLSFFSPEGAARHDTMISYGTRLTLLRNRRCLNKTRNHITYLSKRHRIAV